MAQDPHVIDLRRSYLPMDPNQFPPTMHGTENEDAPEGRVPVLPYDGYNFMPTPQGYASFFGINSRLGVDAIINNVDELFVIQKVDFTHLGVALKDDGIWTKDLTTGGAWTQVIVLAVPTLGTHKNWSRCVIDQTVYVYRQGEASVWKANAANSYVFTAFVPSFLNMAGQLGIFKAGSRLGFWDSENSTAWSALDDTSDVTPSITTLAGNTIFQDIVGRIVNVLQHGTGFIIYCTRSIVHVTRTVDSPMLFSGKAIFNTNGISYRTEVCIGDPDVHHFVMTTAGLCEITNGQSQFISPETSRYFKEQRMPFALQFLNGKYLCLSFISPDYNIGRVLFNEETTPAIAYEWGAANNAIAALSSDSPSEKVTNAIRTVDRNWDQVYLNRQFGYTSYLQAGAAQVPIWRDNIVSCIPLSDLAIFKVYLDNQEPEQYFVDTGFTNGAIPKISGGNEFFLPTKGPDLNSSFATTVQQETNQKNFFSKQDAIFYYEEKFFIAWYEAIKDKIIRSRFEATTGNIYSDTPLSSIEGNGTPVITTYTLSQFVEPSFYSERNKCYGVAIKSAWLQRSLTYGKQIKINSIVTPIGTGSTEMRWRKSQGPVVFNCVALADVYLYATTYTSISSLISAVIAHNHCELDASGNGFLKPTIFIGMDEQSANIDLVQPRQVVLHFHNSGAGPGVGLFDVIYTPWDDDTSSFVGYPTAPYTWSAGLPVYKSGEVSSQTFEDISERVEYSTCIHKELGFTEIIGHGHYASSGSFIQDDSTSEAPDYTDICTLSPTISQQPIFRNVAGGAADDGFDVDYPGYQQGPFYGWGSVSINGITYNYPEGLLPTASFGNPIIPGSTVFLQAGSIEPLYPTYEGAFIFDTHLRKWGKMKGQFKNILDVFPVNTVAGEGFFPYENFMPKLGCRITDGTIYLFDEFPSVSELVFGKVGFYRKGFTDLEEILFQHRVYKSGTLRIEPSINGRNVDNTQIVQIEYDNMAVVQQGYSLSARWYNIVFTGFFDLISLEARGYRAGKR